MRTRNILITSTAAVIAAIAIGASGAQAAGVDLFGSKSIKDDTVRSIDVKDDTIRAKDLRPGLVKSLGTDSASEMIVGAGYTDVWAPHSYGESVEECPEGQYAIGGGYSTFGGFAGTHDGYDLGGLNRDIQVTVSAPYFKGAYEPVDEAGNFRSDQWVVRGYNNGDTEQVVRAWVVCSNVAD